jgi:hypothetical protein
MLRITRDPGELEATLRRVLQAQKDPRTRELYLSVYSAQEPERGRRLAEELARAQ